MTAPEKPWPDNAWLTYKVATSVWGRQVFPNTTEYVRADLHAAALAREAALREALAFYAKWPEPEDVDTYGIHDDAGRIARAALGAQP